MVMERGESLDEWHARIQPDFPAVVQVLSHVTKCVAALHAHGLIHRNLKPGNILWLPGQHSWTLLDFGCAADIGAPELLLLIRAATIIGTHQCNILQAI